MAHRVKVLNIKTDDPHGGRKETVSDHHIYTVAQMHSHIYTHICGHKINIKILIT